MSHSVYEIPTKFGGTVLLSVDTPGILHHILWCEIHTHVGGNSTPEVVRPSHHIIIACHACIHTVVADNEI